MTKSDIEENNSFGVRFGRLVRSCRDDMGLSVKDLAVSAWNDEGRKASISRLENGHVANPAARTIQILAHALDIPQEEIDKLRNPANSLPSQLDDLNVVRRDQLEALASRFEIERVFEKSDVELRSLLDEKATEYREFKQQLKELDGRFEELTSIKFAAREAAAKMEFAEHDSLLRRVDEIYSDLAVRAKEARARNALLRGRIGLAYDLFASAAAALSNLDPVQSAEKRLEYHRSLFEHGLRYDVAGLQHSARILKPVFDTPDWAASRRARAYQNYANALANIGIRSEGFEGAANLEEAIHAYHKALSLVTAESNSDVWGMIQQNLGAALSLRAKICENPANSGAYLSQAVEAFTAALEFRSKHDLPREWAMTTQNLAVAILEKANVTSGSAGVLLLKQAKDLLLETLTVRTRSESPFDWALTQENLAIVTKSLGERSEKSISAEYFSAAQNHVSAALEVYEGEGKSFYHEKARTLENEILQANGQ